MNQKSQDEILAEMKEAQAKQRDVARKTGMTAKGGNSEPVAEKKSVKKNKGDSTKKITVEQLEAKVKALKKEKADLQDQVESKQQANTYEEEQEALNSVVRNNDDYHFVHKYTVSTDKGQHRDLVVKMHAPSVGEQAEIQQEYAELTNYRGQGFMQGMQELFLAVAYFRVVGDNVPEWFTNIDKTYRVDILMRAWSDYQEWLDFFLQGLLQ